MVRFRERTSRRAYEFRGVIMKYELSDLENQILDSINPEFDYMVRDSDTLLHVCTGKPEKRFYGAWMGDNFAEIPLNLFKFIQWGDDKVFDIRKKEFV